MIRSDNRRTSTPGLACLVAGLALLVGTVQAQEAPAEKQASPEAFAASEGGQSDGVAVQPLTSTLRLALADASAKVRLKAVGALPAAGGDQAVAATRFTRFSYFRVMSVPSLVRSKVRTSFREKFRMLLSFKRFVNVSTIIRLGFLPMPSSRPSSP